MTKILRLSFNAGEFSDELGARVDLQKYLAGGRYVSNFIPRDVGSLERRPGTAFVAEVADHDVPPRLVDFVFSDTQAYVIELGDEYARFFMNGGQIAVSGSPYEIVSPFAAADLYRVQYAQTADLMFFAHRGYRPQTLTRTAHADWAFSPWASDTGPFRDLNATTTTLTASGVTGSISLVASAPTFEAGHVGALWRLESETDSEHSMWEVAVAYNIDDTVRYAGNVYRCTEVGGYAKSGQVAPVHIEGERYDGKAGETMKWLYLHSGWGTCRITAVTDSTHATATVIRQLPTLLPSKKWREGAFSEARGWPACVALSGERLWFAGTRAEPQTVWGSVRGDTTDFTPGTNADDAVTFTVLSKRANPVQAMTGGRTLYVLTTEQVYQISGSNSVAIKPDDVQALPITTAGSNAVQPVSVDRAVLFVDRTGKRLQEIGYQLEADEDAARDLTKIASHILRPGRIMPQDHAEFCGCSGTIHLDADTPLDGESDGSATIVRPDGSVVDATSLQSVFSGARQAAWLGDPWKSLFVARTDGLLVAMTYDKDEDVWSWSRHPMNNGAVMSVASIPSAVTGQDELWLVVRRDIGDAAKYYVERMTARIEPASTADKARYVFLDSSLTYDGELETSFSGLDHLEGQVCSVWADGAYAGDVTIEEGGFSIDTAARVVTAGLHTRSTYVSLPVPETIAERQIIASMTLKFQDTLYGKTGRWLSDMDTIAWRETGHAMDASPPLMTGLVKTPMPGVWDDEGVWAVRQDVPAPMTLLGAFPNYRKES